MGGPRQDLRQVGRRFQILSAKRASLPRGVPRKKVFTFEKFGSGAWAAAGAYRFQVAEDHGPLLQRQYRNRVDPTDGLPYIEFRIRDMEGKDHYPLCDVEDLSLLRSRPWHIDVREGGAYVGTRAFFEEKVVWGIVRFYSYKGHLEPADMSAGRLDNRDKSLPPRAPLRAPAAAPDFEEPEKEPAIRTPNKISPRWRTAWDAAEPADERGAILRLRNLNLPAKRLRRQEAQRRIRLGLLAD